MSVPKVCMISCLHPLKDDRIYWKEARSLQKHGYEVIHLGVSEDDYDEVSEHNIRLISIKRKRYFQNPFIDKVYRTLTFRENIYKKLLKVATNLEANVYHFHDLQLNRIGATLKRLPHKPKVVYDVHEPYPEIEKHLIKKGVFRKITGRFFTFRVDKLQKKNSKWLDGVITTEENVLRYYKSFFHSGPSEIIYNYPFTPTERDSNVEKIYDLIYIGGISSWRGIYLLLEIARVAKEKNKAFKILCLGPIKEAGLGESINKFLTENKLEEHFILKSFVPFNEVANFLKKSKLGFCVFKNNPVYKIIMPIKLFEYMAYGLPVIGNNFGHVKEIIESENCGLTIDKQEPQLVFSVLESLIASTEEMQSLSRNGISAVNNKYNWRTAEIALLEFYHKIFDYSNAHE